MITHKGFQIVSASATGGKAGKGHNKTSTVQVRWPTTGGYLKMAQFRFKVGDAESLREATMKAMGFADNPPKDSLRLIHGPSHSTSGVGGAVS